MHTYLKLKYKTEFSAIVVAFTNDFTNPSPEKG